MPLWLGILRLLVGYEWRCVVSWVSHVVLLHHLSTWHQQACSGTKHSLLLNTSAPSPPPSPQWYIVSYYDIRYNIIFSHYLGQACTSSSISMSTLPLPLLIKWIYYIANSIYRSVYDTSSSIPIKQYQQHCVVIRGLRKTRSSVLRYYYNEINIKQ